MELKEIPISKVRPAAYNPRKDLKPGDPAYDKLKKALLEFGLVEPLVWNKRTGNLVGGHQRFKILKDGGEKKLTVSVVDLDDEQEKLLNIALNKQGGEWEFSALADLLQDLDTGNVDMELTGFDAKELEKMMGWTPPAEESSTNGAVDIKEQYLVMVECSSEGEQRKILERFTGEGLKCRALIS